MLFENKGKWFNESEDTDKDMLNDEQQELAMEDDNGDLLADDEMNLAEEDIDDDSEGIFNDEEQVDEACKQKDESARKNEGVHFSQPNVDKCYNELMDISFQEMKKRNGKELSDKEFEAFRPTLLKKYPKEVVDYCYMKANESAQTNEDAESLITIKSIIIQYNDKYGMHKGTLKSNIKIKPSDLTKKYFTTLLSDTFLQSIMPDLQKDASYVLQNYKVDQVTLAQKLTAKATFSVQNGYAILSLPDRFAGWSHKDMGPMIQGKNGALKLFDVKIIAGPIVITKQLELNDLK